MADQSRMLVLELPEDAFVMAAAREGGVTDADLDAIEASLLEDDLAPEEGAASALAIGRAGRASSRSALRAYEDRLLSDGHEDHARAVRLAQELLEHPPPPRVEQAESGYRRTDPQDSSVLFVEDPLAAYWHRRGRWGPPLRPAIESPDVVPSSSEDRDALMDRALDGQLVRVEFRPGPLRGLRAFATLVDSTRLGQVLRRLGLQRPLLSPEPPLWLTRAGLTRDRTLLGLVRWSNIRSIGFVDDRFRRRVAYELSSGAVHALPLGGTLSVEDLHGVLVELAQRARA